MRKSLLILLAGITACSNQQKADTIYYNGNIITMNEQQPSVEAVALQKGKILATGTLNEISNFTNKKTELIDLSNKTLLPGFIDAHGHTFGVGMQSVSANLYSVPDGKIKSIDDINTVLMDYYKTNPTLFKELKWLVGFGYDNSTLKEQRHPTKEDLDKVFPNIPVYILHQSGHIGVANSKALEVLNITKDTPNPEGGIIRRIANSMEPNGVLEESIHLKVFFEVGKFSPLFASKMFLSGANSMASYGFTTAQEARASSSQLIVMKLLSVFRQLPIDIIAYADFEKAPKWIKYISKKYSGRFRIGGVKITLDGSPQGKTAWRDTPYVVPPHGHSHDYVGYPSISRETTFKTISNALSKGNQIITHANGEAAIELFLDGVEHAKQSSLSNDVRPILIHGQFLQKNQVDRLKSLNILASVFPLHTYYWGDWHREQTIGEPGVNNISPTKWLEDQDIIFTIHNDAPIVPPNSIMSLWSAVNRISRTGKIVGKQQQISILTALKSITSWAAYQIFEEDSKGSIEKGKLADFVILSENPLVVLPQDLTNIIVLETIKEGRTIYQNSNSTKLKAYL